MGLDLFLIIVVLYVVMGIGTAKAFASLNYRDSTWDGGFHIIVFTAWPLFIIGSAFWNFEK